MRTLLCSKAFGFRSTFFMVLIDPQMTDGIHQVIHHLHCQVCFPRRNLLGRRIRMHIRHWVLGFSGNMLSNSQTNWQRTSLRVLNHWTSQHRRNQQCLRLSIPSSMGSHLNGFSHRAQTMNFSLALTKTSRPYETDLQLFVMSEPSITLERHLTSNGCAKSIFREAYERRHFLRQPKFSVDHNVPNRLLEQVRISILSWNPGPRRGKPGAIAEHIAGNWHVSALQEAIEYFQHECLTNHFYITHVSRCAILVKKDILHSDMKVNSVHINDDRNGQQQADNQGGFYKPSSPVPRSEGYRAMVDPTLP